MSFWFLLSITFLSEVSMTTISEILGRRVQLKGLIGKRAVKCPYCDFYFMKNGSDLQRHIWAHEGKTLVLSFSHFSLIFLTSFSGIKRNWNPVVLMCTYNFWVYFNYIISVASSWWGHKQWWKTHKAMLIIYNVYDFLRKKK